MPLATSLAYFGIKFPLFPLRIPHKGKNKGKYISFHYLRGWKACKIRKVQEISPQIPILRGKSVCFFVSVSTSSGHFVPKSGVGQGTGAFIYALSAGETSPALAAPCHAITALFSCRFKCPCPPRRQPHFRSNADRAYNTLHFATQSRVPRGKPLWKPQTTKQAEYLALPRCLIFSLYLLSAAPVSWSACSSL